MPDEFARRPAHAYEGEIFGHALFAEMAQSLDDGEQRSALVRLALLEERMGEALTVLIERVGLAVPDEGDAAARGREAATTLASGSWSSFIEAFEPATTKALRGYQCDS